MPIPIPYGHNQIEIKFKDGSAKSLRRSVTVVTGFIMGMIPPLVMAWEMEEPDHNTNGEYVGYGFEKLKMPPDGAQTSADARPPSGSQQTNAQDNAQSK